MISHDGTAVFSPKNLADGSFYFIFLSRVVVASDTETWTMRVLGNKFKKHFGQEKANYVSLMGLQTKNHIGAQQFGTVIIATNFHRQQSE